MPDVAPSRNVLSFDCSCCRLERPDCKSLACARGKLVKRSVSQLDVLHEASKARDYWRLREESRGDEFTCHNVPI